MKSTGQVEVGNGLIYYEFYRQNFEAPVLVLLHEGLGSVAQWKDIPQILFSGLHWSILVYDRTGYGKSSPAPTDYPPDYLRHEAQVVLPGLLQQLKITNCHLWGHSDGGSVALLFAARFPEMALSVVTEAAHVMIEDISRRGIAAIKELYPQKFRLPLERFHGSKVDWVFYHWANKWLSEKFYGWNMFGELMEIRCPVLAIQGMDDEYGSPEQVYKLQELCRAEVWLIEQCGHTPHFQLKDPVLGRITGFLLKNHSATKH